jgi:hypothetical protein
MVAVQKWETLHICKLINSSVFMTSSRDVKSSKVQFNLGNPISKTSKLSTGYPISLKFIGQCRNKNKRGRYYQIDISNQRLGPVQACLGFPLNFLISP